MGKYNKGKGRAGGGGGGGGASARAARSAEWRSQRGDQQPPLDTRNADFERYYTEQGILPQEEWEEFLASCRAVLPTTFRITASRTTSRSVNEHVERFFVPYLSDVVYEGVKQKPPRVLEWYPDHLAWQLDTAKQVIRKSPEFAKFQQFLVHESDSGNISRQEAVSMIPPLLLDVEPHHYVLDCCAAPGSKTTQLLEALHAQSSDGPKAASIPSGLLVANDSDAKRCHMLVHQSLNRIGSPNTMITNLDAAAIPNIRMTDRATGKPKNLLFDRILCDAPCSGDGTMRKNPNIWRTWRTGDGLGLHGLQLRILDRAIQLLKPGGRLVYSTCSFNPMENEAVVSAALEANPSMSLIDVSERLPGLKRRPGMTTWKVYDKDMVELSDRPDAESGGKKQSKGPAITCWPMGNEKEKNLDRCLRLFPHLQDTGGFFVAVLEKAASDRSLLETTPSVSGAQASQAATVFNGDNVDGTASAEQDIDDISGSSKRAASPTISAEPAKRAKVAEEDVESSEGQTVTKATEGGGRPFNEEPYMFLAPDDPQIAICRDFFDLVPDFPVKQLFVRNVEAKPLRSIYLGSPAVQDVIKNNDYAKLRLVSCGVKIFARQDSGHSDTYSCKWRVLQDGLPVMEPLMGPKRKVTASLVSLRNLLMDMYPGFDRLEEQGFKDHVQPLAHGSCICEFKAGEAAGGRLENDIILPLWKAPNSLCLMVEKTEKRGLSLRIFGEDLPAIAASRKQQQKKEEKQNGQTAGGNGVEGPASDPTPKAEDVTTENAVEALEEAVKVEAEDKMAGAEPAEAVEIKGEP